MQTIKANARRQAHKRPAPKARVSAKLTTPTARFRVFIALIVAILLMGGGSRADIVSLVILRPLCAAFAVYAVLQISAEQLRAIRAPLLFLAGLAGLILLQLIPLPAAYWQDLPGRAVYADAYRAAGMVVPWQPLALSPERALNSLFSLLVPFAVTLNFAIQPPERRRDVLFIVWMAVVASVMLGVAQLLGSASGPLYLYRITNNGLPVGFLANRNHQALLVCAGILIAGYFAARALSGRKVAVPLLALAGGSVLLFAPFLLVTGSRAGLAVGVVSILVSGLIVASAVFARSRRNKLPLRSDRTALVVIVVTIAILAAVVISAVVMSRSLALERLLAKSVELDLRVKVMPVVLDMARGQFPLGSGFGSFEYLYRQMEPIELLMPSYLNHAHNDWLEFLIEGGAPAAALLVAFMLWLAQSLFSIVRQRRLAVTSEAFVCFGVLTAVALFSVVDYPLRVPIVAAVAAICCCILSQIKQDQPACAVSTR